MTIVQMTLSRSLRMRIGARIWLTLLAITVVSIPLHLGLPTPDVSWLIRMCEEILEGQTAYVDILETTPPVPTLLYMPAAMIGRLTGIPSEFANVAVTYLAGILVLALTAAILPRDTLAARRSTLFIMAAAAAGLLLFPADSFAQREYFAAAFGLPMVAVFLRHARTGEWPALRQRAAATILVAITVAIKPPVFLLPGIFVGTYYVWRTRRPMFLVASGLLPAAILSGVVTVLCFALFPHYFDEVWPIMQDVYVPARSHPLSFATDKAALGAMLALACTAALQIGRAQSPGILLMLLAGAGFLAAYFVQGKYISYHSYPAMLFLSLALASTLAERSFSAQTAQKTLDVASTIVIAAVYIVIVTLSWTGFRDTRPRLHSFSWAEALKSPTVMAISPDIATAFPLTRQIGGVWVDRTHSQWVARYTRHLLIAEPLTRDRRALLEKYHRDDLFSLVRGVESRRPEIILVDTSPGYAWLMKELLAIDPHLLADYGTLAEDGRVRVLRRKGVPSKNVNGAS